MLIGGYAVVFHGYNRTTGDMDLWLRPTNENKERLIKALREQGIDPEFPGELEEMEKTDEWKIG